MSTSPFETPAQVQFDNQPPLPMVDPTQPEPQKPQTMFPESNFENLRGHEFLIPPNELDVELQLPLMEQLDKLSDGEGNSINIGATTGLIRFFRENFVRDQDGFNQLAKGQGAVNRVIELVSAYAAELGKESSSES